MVAIYYSILEYVVTAPFQPFNKNDCLPLVIGSFLMAKSFTPHEHCESIRREILTKRIFVIRRAKIIRRYMRLSWRIPMSHPSYCNRPCRSTLRRSCQCLVIPAHSAGRWRKTESSSAYRCSHQMLVRCFTFGHWNSNCLSNSKIERLQIQRQRQHIAGCWLISWWCAGVTETVTSILFLCFLLFLSRHTKTNFIPTSSCNVASVYTPQQAFE